MSNLTSTCSGIGKLEPFFPFAGNSCDGVSMDCNIRDLKQPWRQQERHKRIGYARFAFWYISLLSSAKHEMTKFTVLRRT